MRFIFVFAFCSGSLNAQLYWITTCEYISGKSADIWVCEGLGLIVRSGQGVTYWIVGDKNDVNEGELDQTKFIFTGPTGVSINTVHKTQIVSYDLAVPNFNLYGLKLDTDLSEGSTITMT